MKPFILNATMAANEPNNYLAINNAKATTAMAPREYTVAIQLKSETEAFDDDACGTTKKDAQTNKAMNESRLHHPKRSKRPSLKPQQLPLKRKTRTPSPPLQPSSPCFHSTHSQHFPKEYRFLEYHGVIGFAAMVGMKESHADTNVTSHEASTSPSPNGAHRNDNGARR